MHGISYLSDSRIDNRINNLTAIYPVVGCKAVASRPAIYSAADLGGLSWLYNTSTHGCLRLGCAGIGTLSQKNPTAVRYHSQ